MRLEDAVAEADVRVLLMCVFHLSGDRRWLEPPFAPRRDVRLVADEDAGLPPDVVAEIRAAAVELATARPVVDDPGDDLMLTMLRVATGEEVPAEYAPMMREEAGFCSRDVEWSTSSPPAERRDHHVLVVGAGASGITIGARLARLDVPFTIVEQASALGGVWRDNRYPGCGVDTPNHTYSFSFVPPHRWSRFFAPRDELADYLERSADDCGLTDRIEFDTAVRRAAWDEQRQRWSVELEGPAGRETRSFTALVSAIGQLNEPAVPPIAGIDEFGGACFHSARWPEDLDHVGRRVAVVGTGASSMQIVPAIVDEVASLTIYQRSAQWARPIPRYHDPIPEGSQWLFDHLPYYAQWFRITTSWRFSDALLPHLRKDPDWPHPERSLNRVNERHRVEMTEFIEAELGERRDLLDKCLPTYPPYGKRILMDNGWYGAIVKPHVELVTDGIERVDRTGIVARDGTHRPADIIVLATGFQITEMAARLDITGVGGVNLRERWSDDNPTAYLGITVPDFPNLFVMQGPNTGLGHGGSAIFQSECQARYISGCLVEMIERSLTSIDVTPAAHDRWIEQVDAEHEQLVWTHPGMSTYYRNPRGRVVSVTPFRLVDYWSMTHDAALDEYDVTPRPR